MVTQRGSGPSSERDEPPVTGLGRMKDVSGLPVLLDVAGRRVVVVGGGQVAARRVRSLQEAGASVHVVAPEISAELAGGEVALHRRSFRDTDLDGAWLALA